MRAIGRYGWVLLVLCSPASAQPARSVLEHAVAEQSAAAVRVAARFGMITSTFRSVEHNRAVGGVPDSYHLLGQAIDVVRRPGVTHAQIAAALSAAGLHLVESLDERDHSHFAFGPAVKHKAVRLHLAPPPPQPPNQPQPQRLLAADQHGMLLVDLGSHAQSSRNRVRGGASGRLAAH